MKHATSRDLELLFEIGCLRFVQRTWRQFLNPDFSNNAEHMFRVTWIALLIAKREGVKNEEKVLKMALMHDIGESRTPDLHYVSRLYSTRNEEKAIDDMLTGTAFVQEFNALFKEYEERKTIESKIVKDADNLDVDLELREQEAQGSNMKKVWDEKRQVVYDMLFTKTAKKLWKQLQTANPHQWHLKARNRFTEGDWKKK